MIGQGSLIFDQMKWIIMFIVILIMTIFSIITTHNARATHLASGGGSNDTLYQFYFINLIVSYIVAFFALLGMFGYAKLAPAGASGYGQSSGYGGQQYSSSPY